MNQGKLEVVKQEMARVNVDILGISKLKLAFALLHSVLQVQICLLLQVYLDSLPLHSSPL